MMRKYMPHAGALLGIVGLSFFNMLAIVVSMILLVWYAMTDLRKILFDAHHAALDDEGLPFGDNPVPISECTLGPARYVLDTRFPLISCVTQLFRPTSRGEKLLEHQGKP